MKSQLIGAAAILSSALARGACAYDRHDYGHGYGHGIDNEEELLRDRFGDDVEVERDGDRLNLRILGDVLFALDSARLRPRARDIIGSIADELRQYGYEDIEVNGFTDTSGTSAHNQQLSGDRANAVAEELVRDGVDPGRIHAQGFGETQLAVPTPNGVRERRNRRVEIVLRPE